MDSPTLNFRHRKPVPNQPVTTEFPRQHSPLALFAILAILLVTLTISGCVGLAGAGTPAKTSSTSTSSGTLAASPTSLNFGNVATGSKSSQTLTLSNAGTGPVTIVSDTISGVGFTLIGGMSSVSIAAGQSQAFQIQFAPAAPGNVGGSLIVASDASDSALSLSLSGAGVAALSITTQPASQSVTAGQTATFDVTAAGSGALTYQWKKNGTAIGGATSSTYTTPATVASDNGAPFTVVVSDGTSTVTSNPAALTVTAAAVPPSITADPVSQSVTAGQSATFTVAATGTATLTHQWKKNGTVINGATSASYTTPPTTPSDNGAQFTVTVSNSKGNATSKAATLTVNVPPTIATQPASQSVLAGQTATFAVSASGTAPMTYQWKKNGTAIGGATSASYTTAATTNSDNGTSFTVTIANAAGNVTSNAATLAVTATPVAPSIAAQPSSRTVTAGQAATFAVTATGTATLTYQWMRNGAAIGGATSATYTTPATTTSDNGASFTVTIANAAGNATSNAATLTVTAASVAPSITAQPSPQTVTAGQAATFAVTATGTATLTYQWMRNGAAIGGATSATYTTPATTTSDNGASFTVTIANAAGNATSNAATLTVTAASVAPSITAQPSPQTVTAGQPATFAVTATGTATLTYQWMRNGAAIGGATSATYTIPATTTSDNGAQFSVTVRNASGSATSNAAALTVNAATFLLNVSTANLSFANVNIGSNTSLNVTFTNAGNSSVTVSSVTISGAGFTAGGVSTGQILTPGQTATLDVTFAPAGTVPVTGNVTVASNATNSPAMVTLSGTGVQPVSHSATLDWVASPSTIMGYNAYRSAVSGGPYTKVNSSLITAIQYADPTVLAGQTYFYVVTSVDSSGAESTFSNEVSGTIPTP
jgi:hypothetical protein